MTSLTLRFKRLLYTSYLLVVIMVCPSFCQELPTAKPEDVGVSSTKVEQLSTFMQSLVDDGKIAGGVTMMARHGKVIHLKAVGMADRDEKKPMTTDAIFRIASMTKPITSVAIMMLCEQGKLNLDDPVSKYIPEFTNPQVLVSVNPRVDRPANREITIRHLLTHTSGLGYPNTDKIGPMYVENNIPCGCVTASVTLEENMKRLARVPLLFDPGEKWEYGMSTDVLGRVVEAVAKTTLDQYFKEKIFQPLGMRDTTFRVSTEQQQRLTAAYTFGGWGHWGMWRMKRVVHLTAEQLMSQVFVGLELHDRSSTFTDDTHRQVHPITCLNGDLMRPTIRRGNRGRSLARTAL